MGGSLERADAKCAEPRVTGKATEMRSGDMPGGVNKERMKASEHVPR